MVGLNQTKIFMSNTITPVTSNAGSLYATDTLQGSAKALSQNDFLSLLVKQIQYQDPMNPKSNTDMAAQMAQFTSLSQSSKMSSSLSMMQASSLIGSEVSLKVEGKQVPVTGVVSGVVMDSGTPKILVRGVTYELGQVQSVYLPTATSTSTVTPTLTTPAGPTITTTTDASSGNQF
jgi:flagellar basal-body rod modification protein FlgD